MYKLYERPKRNQMCPCGSGKKFKKCHGPQKTAAAPAKSTALFVSRGIVFAPLAEAAIAPDGEPASALPFTEADLDAGGRNLQAES